MEPGESESEHRARRRVGRKAQMSGGLALFLGVLLLVSLPPTPPGIPIDLRPIAEIFIAIGALLLAAGTFARWYFLR
jgi:hypothetical protein